MAQGVGPEFKPQYHKKKKRERERERRGRISLSATSAACCLPPFPRLHPHSVQQSGCMGPPPHLASTPRSWQALLGARKKQLPSSQNLIMLNGDIRPAGCRFTWPSPPQVPADGIDKMKVTDFPHTQLFAVLLSALGGRVHSACVSVNVHICLQYVHHM
jgi:hypothetical protein